MRNAVIRKKALSEQAALRKFMYQPTRLITPAVTVDWTEANEKALREFANTPIFAH